MPRISHRDFSVEYDSTSQDVCFMFNEEYSFEFDEFVTFLKCIQEDKQLWEILSLRYARQCTERSFGEPVSHRRYEWSPR